MITTAAFQNFKTLGKVEIDFSPFTVIVGPNGSGKSTILEGLQCLSLACFGKREELLTGVRHPLFLQKRGTTSDIILSCGNNEVGIRLVAKPPIMFPTDLLHPRNSNSVLDGHWDITIEEQSKGRGGNGWKEAGEHSQARYSFGSAMLLRLEAAQLAMPSYSGLPKPYLHVDGEGLASVLAFMALNQPDDFQALQSSAKDVIPNLKRLRFDRIPIKRNEVELVTIDNEQVTRRITREYVGDSIVFDFLTASDIPAHAVSEGTMLVLGVLAALSGPIRPQLLMIDDLEHGLHPRAQQRVVELLRQIQAQRKDLQIIATTHSPYLLDSLAPEEVRLTMLGSDGSASCAPLTDHPDFSRWKDEMSPGELWSLFGENWIQPAAANGT